MPPPPREQVEDRHHHAEDGDQYAGFDPENAVVLAVRRIVRDVLERGRELDEIHARKDPGDRERLEEVVADLNALFAELESVGCTFRAPSYEFGLVDFPGEIEGQRVNLCWHSDEESITHYYLPNQGFAGRQSIPSEPGRCSPR